MKYAHVGINLLLVSAIPNFAVHAESPSLIHLDLPPEFAKSSPFIQKLFTEDNLLSYDALIELIEAIENDTLGPCTPEDMQQISELIAHLARQGLMPDASEIEKAELEVDVAEMLSSNPFAETNYWIGDQSYSILPAVYYYDGMTAVPCKGWFHKQWKHVKHFVHEHKTAIIIGTILVVAAVVIVATVATGGAAAAPVAAAGTAAGAAIDSKKETKSAEQPAPQQATVIETSNELKEAAVQSNLLPISSASLDAEQVRFIGSTLTHETVQTSPNIGFYPPFESSLITAGHGAADLAFSTDQASNYLTQSYSSLPSCNLFMAQGDQALKVGDYEQAVDYYNQAIDVDPHNNDVYLQRAYAYMGNDDLSLALSDYRIYNTHTINQTTPQYSVDFCIGFAKGLPKGAVESANQLVSFAGELAQHPIDTTCQICKSFGTLASMTCSGEWKELSQALAPEVCELVQKWDTLPSREQGELAGYLVGKYGGDILIPGAATKVLAKGVKGAEEMFAIAKNVQTAEQAFTVEAIAYAGEEVFQHNQTMVALGEDIGLSKCEMIKLKQNGNLENTITNGLEKLVSESESDIFKTAISQNKHIKMVKDYLEKPSKEIQKGINSYEKQITIQRDKIVNPTKYYPDWDRLDPRQREALINKKWPAEIQGYEEQKNILQSILNERLSHE